MAKQKSSYTVKIPNYADVHEKIQAAKLGFQIQDSPVTQYVTSDPVVREEAVRRLNLTESAVLHLKKKSCLTRTEFESGTNSAAADRPGTIYRVLYRSPLPDKDDKTDRRGRLERLTGVSVRVKNNMDQQVQVHMAFPKTFSATSASVTKLDEKTIVDVGPFGSVNRNSGFSPAQNRFPVILGADRNIALLQFFVVVDDINTRTGSAFPDDTDIVSLHITVNCQVNSVGGVSDSGSALANIALEDIQTIENYLTEFNPEQIPGEKVYVGLDVAKVTLTSVQIGNDTTVTFKGQSFILRKSGANDRYLGVIPQGKGAGFLPDPGFRGTDIIICPCPIAAAGATTHDPKSVQPRNVRMFVRLVDANKKALYVALYDESQIDSFVAKPDSQNFCNAGGTNPSDLSAHVAWEVYAGAGLGVQFIGSILGWFATALKWAAFAHETLNAAKKVQRGKK